MTSSSVIPVASQSTAASHGDNDARRPGGRGQTKGIITVHQQAAQGQRSQGAVTIPQYRPTLQRDALCSVKKQAKQLAADGGTPIAAIGFCAKVRQRLFR